MARWHLLTEYLQGCPDSVTVSWAELDAIVGGLPPSATKHRPWWSGDRPQVNAWKSAGYTFTDLHMGSQVTFVRGGAPARASRMSANAAVAATGSAPQPTGDRPVPDLVLVSCVKTKRAQACEAQDLYVSALFTKERTYAEAAGVPWYILSAEHGLVRPKQWLKPYSRYLPHESAAYRQAWGRAVVQSLVEAEGPLAGKVIEVHASAPYVDAIRPGLRAQGATVTDPLHGLRQGERLQWYGGARPAPKREVAAVRPVISAPVPDLPSVEALVSALSDANMAIDPQAFLAAGSDGLQVPGLYSWWVDAPGALELTAGLGHRIAPGLIYAGLAGATHWPSGKPSTNTLWLRISSMHLGRKHEFSTFRRSVGGILAAATGATQVDESALSAWMDRHLRVIAVAYVDADALGRIETAVLERLDPPLNLRGMPDSEIRRELKALRKRVV